MAQRQRDGNQIIVSSGVEYSDFQRLRDTTLELRSHIEYMKKEIAELEEFNRWARKEWETREGTAIGRITLLEISTQKHEGIMQGAATTATSYAVAISLIIGGLGLLITVMMR